MVTNFLNDYFIGDPSIIYGCRVMSSNETNIESKSGVPKMGNQNLLLISLDRRSNIDQHFMGQTDEYIIKIPDYNRKCQFCCEYCLIEVKFGKKYSTYQH